MTEEEIEQHAFETLEKEFQEVIAELATDPALEKFRQEYEKLYKLLISSHENEKRLLKKCKELNADIGNSNFLN